ncbi:hypothetical protein QWY82_00250 [Simiduia curdlanivorans]|uniref:hypothetical protein n=1 Tax=Simiduia curdlanivorans TaxID=1492769 RepID=UPI0025B5E903|nr:hypothetical protein [Simiduia curdlanivorans]MDN3637223.1 hypothetical protein [Simiduia curdlanivorans]
MVAPKAPGHTVRSEYQRGSGVPDLIAIHQDASGNARNVALSYASGVGGGRTGIIETSFREETELTYSVSKQFFVVVLLNWLKWASKLWLKLVMHQKWLTSNAYIELKLIVDLMFEGGIADMTTQFLTMLSTVNM